MPDNQEKLADAMRASQHDMTAFAPIYEAFAGRIYSYCLYRVRSVADAEDLTSQVFARAMDKCHTFKGDNVGAWLFRIAYHITVGYYCTKRPDPLSPSQLSVLSAPDTSPLDRVIQDEEMAYLDDLLAKLDEDKRNLLLLRITADLSAAEVGEIVGKSATAVRTEIHRIIQQLKRTAVLYSAGD